MRLSPVVVVVVLAAMVGIRLGVAPVFGFETLFQRAIEACAGLGVLAAALAFERGDPPLRPWATLAAAMLIVPLARLALYLDLNAGDAKVGYLLFILSNILCIVALLGFRRMLVSTGLTPEWTSSARIRAVVIAGIIVAACIGLISAQLNEMGDLSAMTAAGALSSSVTLISIIADAVIFGIGLLLVRLVAPMMGGSVAQPYILVAIGGAIFLFVDLFSVLSQVTTQDQFTSPVPLALATVGWSAIALAGLSQRGQVRD
jgi:hypothetical protein